jgi:hypothetical protein
MKISTYQCSYCPQHKQQSNHWFIFVPNVPLSADIGSDRVRFETDALFSKWNDVVADMLGVEHICSESCASKALTKWLGAASGNVVPQKHEAQSA